MIASDATPPALDAPLPTAESSPKPLDIVSEESETTRLARLGRQRPSAFPTLSHEIFFVLSIILSQALSEYFVSGFTVLVPTVVSALSIPPASTTWLASAFSLVISAFLLPFGRLADIHGGFRVYLAGSIWFLTWSLIAGFAQNELMLDFSRALQGLGPAATLPAGLTLLGGMYRPGPRKNLVFSIYGAMAPLGFFLGIFVAGMSAQFASWRWYFWTGAVLIALGTVGAWFAIPSDARGYSGNGVRMDWWGSATTSAGVVLLVFALTDASRAPSGWAEPYILVTLIAGLGFLGAAFYVEGWVAEQPLLPFDVFRIKGMRPLVVALLFVYGSVGIYLLYATLYAETILTIPPLQLVAWFTPMAVTGCLLAVSGGLILHITPPIILMLLTGISIILSSLLWALAPSHANYWAWYFPAMIFAAAAIDLMFSVANVFFSTKLPAHQQGLAGALGNVLVQLGIAVALGVADSVRSAAEGRGRGVEGSYRGVFWLEVACGGVALGVMLGFVRIGRAESEWTEEEKRARVGVGEGEAATAEAEESVAEAARREVAGEEGCVAAERGD